METGLEGRPWYFGLAIGALVGAMALFLGYRAKLKDMEREIERQRTQIVDLDNQIRRGESAKAQLPQFRERVARLEVQLDKLLEILPDRRNVHELLRQFRALAESEDFNLTRFNPSEEVEQDYLYEWPIALSLEGTYHNLARFFDRMSRFSRIINIDDLRISATRSPSPVHSIDATFTAKTFVYKDAETTAAAATVEGGR